MVYNDQSTGFVTRVSGILWSAQCISVKSSGGCVSLFDKQPMGKSWMGLKHERFFIQENHYCFLMIGLALTSLNEVYITRLFNHLRASSGNVGK